MKTKIILAVFLLSVTVSTSFAFYGARPMGMGGAFTAIADDANAAYWNPAGFALNPETSITGSTLLTNRNSQIGDNFAALKMSGTTNLAELMGWFSIVNMALDSLQFLADIGIIKESKSDEGLLKLNVGRDVKKTKREESFAEQVKKGPEPPKAAPAKPKKEEEDKQDGLKTKVYGYEQSHYSQHRHYYYGQSMDEGLRDISAEFAMGLTWAYDNNTDKDQNTNWYSVSFASGKKETAVVGMNINFYDLKIPSINTKGFGAGLDFGIILRPSKTLSIGLTAKEAFTSDITWQNGTVTRYEMLVNGGAAFSPIDGLTVAVDTHNLFSQNQGPRTMHYGLEFRPIKELALRGGLNNNSKTAGASVGIKDFYVDYAYLGGDFNKTQIVSANLKF